MEDNTADRTAALRDLVELRKPPREARSALARFGWDSGQDLVSLSRADARRLLDCYSRGGLGAEDCAIWADALEGRDDLGYEQGQEDLLTNFLFEIANPEINGPLTAQLVDRWQAALHESP
jgi:hypothetical protein